MISEKNLENYLNNQEEVLSFMKSKGGLHNNNGSR
jgi:hypothetical protein